MAASGNRVFTCGASAISLDHKPGEPTIFDKVARAFKGTNKEGQQSSAKHDLLNSGADRDGRIAEGSVA
ncbi:MAG: hypothetical protein IJ131_05535 [Eggerthellaceae bacterium]|nr:hypothetical protein [Eggerthellaceae bacterium]